MKNSKQNGNKMKTAKSNLISINFKHTTKYEEINMSDVLANTIVSDQTRKRVLPNEVFLGKYVIWSENPLQRCHDKSMKWKSGRSIGTFDGGKCRGQRFWQQKFNTRMFLHVAIRKHSFQLRYCKTRSKYVLLDEAETNDSEDDVGDISSSFVS